MQVGHAELPAMTPRLGPSSGPIPLSQPLEPPEPPSPQPEPDSSTLHPADSSVLLHPVALPQPAADRRSCACAGNSPLSLAVSPVPRSLLLRPDLASVLPSSAVARAWLWVLLCLSPQLTTDWPPQLPGSISSSSISSSSLLPLLSSRVGSSIDRTSSGASQGLPSPPSGSCHRESTRARHVTPHARVPARTSFPTTRVKVTMTICQ